jgi:hypothetical protein
MKIIAAVFLIIFVSFGEAVVLSGEYSFYGWIYLQNAYTYQSVAQNTGDFIFIQELQGDHLDGKGNEDVEVWYETGNTLLFIPSNLPDFFPNLKALVLKAPLNHLTAYNLESFPDLLWFYSKNGQFRSIEGDLFKATKKIKWLDLFQGKIEHVGEFLLSDLNDLVYADFSDNTCIDFKANTAEKIEQLKQKLVDQCAPLEGPFV